MFFKFVPELKEASDIFEAAKADPEKRRLIQEREDAVRNYNNAISVAVEEERAKAHAEKIETARKLLIAGVSIEIISSSTGLQIEDIRKFQ